LALNLHTDFDSCPFLGSNRSNCAKMLCGDQVSKGLSVSEDAVCLAKEIDQRRIKRQKDGLSGSHETENWSGDAFKVHHGQLLLRQDF